MSEVKRKLASVQKIVALRPIENADKIEVAQVLNWECVVKKGEFQVGHLIVYIEIDSIVPERAEFEFLRERKFRVKTIKLRKQISQGLVVGPSILPSGNYCEDMDVTDILGIKKYDPQAQEEQQIINTSVPKSKVLKYLMNYSIFRYIYLKFNTVDKGWPSWIQKTDEERLAVCAKKITNNFDKIFYVSEKLDGSSGTFFIHKNRKWGFPTWGFGVCSRNIWLKKEDNSNYWKIAKKYDLQNKLKNLKKEIVVQGEIIGPAIQKNKYSLKDIDFYVFNVVENGVKYSPDQMILFCEQLGLKHVPILAQSTVWALVDCKKEDVSQMVQALVKYSNANSALAPVPREGIVMRVVDDPSVSLKVISPEFLLKYEE